MAGVSETDTDPMLLPAPFRRPAVGVLLICVGTVSVLGARYAGHSQAGRLDAAIGVRVRAALGSYERFHDLVWLGDPVVVAATAGVLMLGCLCRRRWRAVVMIAVAVAGAGATTELWLKPFIGRTYLGGLAYPSGHATAVFVIAAVVAVLLINPPHPRMGTTLRAFLGTAALATAGVVCVAVHAAGNHYGTDLVGGAAVGIAAALLTSLVVDTVAARLAQSTESRRGHR